MHEEHDYSMLPQTTGAIALRPSGNIQGGYYFFSLGSCRHDAMAYLMFLKQKRTGHVKGRGCADGKKQRIYTIKEEASSPTVAIESVLRVNCRDRSVRGSRYRRR
jgi:hypothetical protein